MTKKIIFDTDPGVDDAMALLFAEASTDLEVVGITTVHGNASIETTTRNALYLKHAFQLPATVAKGADKPLSIPPGEPITFVHGENGLGDVDIPDTFPQDVDARPAYQYIIDTIKAQPNEITLVAIGPLTNLALALQADPSIASLTKEVVIMGGAFGYNGHRGNITPVAEANMIGDPHAADIVLTAPWPITMVGLDVTQETIMSNAYLAELKDTSPRYGDFIHSVSRFYADFHQTSAGLDGIYVHDSSAIAYLIDPSLFTVAKGKLRVSCDGITIGQTVLKQDERRYPQDDWYDQPTQQVCTTVNSQALRELYQATLNKA
ncbi:nucleoside hydrolase [Marinibactrum halimedae]|uniref:Nucleoside hydrolase n=1 Tax=Marinibactrum halimedae TaxID=1444977 RepID=A0AA37WNM2_9GAMM|nr:nucleoside hydrolase [Marinibactrum halimedae]MCD9459997.1 nucleoside hydrolase [Marinibactrum halimedae]GLS28234.1 nucleoside hydrolase [Marinibactrum halimedae]